jgi:hypothetical protein
MDYANECAAHAAGVSVSRTGECSVVEEDVTETSSTVAAETLPEVLSSLASSSASSFIATIMTLTVVVEQLV